MNHVGALDSQWFVGERQRIKVRATAAIDQPTVAAPFTCANQTGDERVWPQVALPNLGKFPDNGFETCL